MVESIVSDKKTIFSGMQPSGQISLGNYLGALKSWVNLQDEYNCIFCSVNLHSLTVRQNPELLRQNTKQLIALYIAAGLDPNKNLMFLQSDVYQHTQLSWILNCYTYFGELNRMTQFKEKSAKYEENINAGLFTYPVLMASDILLYKTNLVPVGEDQKQHLELARDIAIRFNKIYGETFIVPEPYIGKVGARIMGLLDPTKKMSKSDNNGNTIFLTDEPNIILNKVKRAVTDSDNQIRFDTINKPGISNLLSIYSSITQKTILESEEELKNKGYGDLKKIVAEVIIEEILPIQEKFKELCKNEDYINEILKQNAIKAQEIADKNLNEVYKKIGIK